MAGSTVITLGAGTIILLVLWAVTGSVWFFLHRSQSMIRYVTFFVSAVITLILFLLPPDTGSDADKEALSALDDDVIYDYMFIWKAILILILSASLLGGMLLNIGEYWMMKVHGSKSVPLSKKNPVLESEQKSEAIINDEDAVEAEEVETD